jgi:hypothetical protein
MTAQLELFGAGADLERDILDALRTLARAKYPGWRYTTAAVLSLTRGASETAIDAALRGLEARGEARRCAGAPRLWTLATWPSRGALAGEAPDVETVPGAVDEVPAGACRKCGHPEYGHWLLTNGARADCVEGCGCLWFEGAAKGTPSAAPGKEG